MTRIPRPGLALALLAITEFILVLDASIVGVALPSIGADLNVGSDGLSWVANAYTLAFGGLLLLGGRSADLLGRRRLFIIGTALFSVASLAGALATTAGMLVAARAIQGIGAAAVAPAALSLLMTIFEPGPARNKAMGVFGAVAGAGGVAGSILGGVLTDMFGWPAIFYVNVPIGLVAVLLAPRLLPEATDPTARGFDLGGAITATAGLALLVYTLVDVDNTGWTSNTTLGRFAAALILLLMFVVIEARSSTPLLPLRILRTPGLGGANLVGALNAMAVFPMFFLGTFYMQQVLGYSPIDAGLAQLPLAIAMAFTAGAASSLMSRWGVRVPTVAGLVVTAVGLAWFSRISADGGFLTDILGPTLIIGAGSGLVFVTAPVAATAGARREQAGIASGLVNTAQQFGGSFGLAAVVAIATAVTTASADNGEQNRAVALTYGYQAGILALTAVTLVAALVAIVMLPRPSTTPIASEDEMTTEPARVAAR